MQRPTIDEIMQMPEVRSKLQYLPLELQRVADEQQVRLPWCGSCVAKQWVVRLLLERHLLADEQQLGLCLQQL